MPKVSIVIPTRNRAHLLRYALSSALRQTYEDLEIVVSDNYSSDDTQRVVESNSNHRLRYVRTSVPLSMPDHWEFALGHARGDYLTILTDDSYLFSNAIESASRELHEHAASVVAWESCTYFAPDWMEPHRQNLLYIRKASFKARLITGDEGLKNLFDLQRVCPAPKFLNSLCHRSVVEKVIAVQKRLFLPSCPDYSSAAGLLQNIDQFLYLDWPLFVDGKTSASIGASARFNWGKAVNEFIGEFKGNLRWTDRFGLNIPTVTLAIAQTLETVRQFYPDRLKYRIQQERLVKEIVDDIVCLESNGNDMSEAWQTLDIYVQRHPKGLGKTAAKQKLKSRLFAALKELRHLPFWDQLERLRGIYVFPGSRLEFSNIEESAKVAERLVLRLAGGGCNSQQKENVASLRT